MATLTLDQMVMSNRHVVENKDNPYLAAYKKYKDKFDTAAKDAGFTTEEEFNEYFFNEFRPAFFEEWKKEKSFT